VTDRIERAAAEVWQAWTGHQVLDDLSPDARPADLAEGMAVQDALRPLAGETYGWKLAATSPAGQAKFGLDAPQPGPLFSRFRHESGDVLPGEGMVLRVVEAEFAFVLGTGIEAGATREQVLDAVSALHLAVEVPETRFRTATPPGAARFAADAARSGRFVLGPDVPGWRELDLSAQRTALAVNGERASGGSGAFVLGDPVDALLWLANALPQWGHELKAGDVVTSGTTTVPPTVAPGDRVRATFGDLGEVSFSFAG
jgi:2-keto-4-pentenoate hydratase